MTSAAYHSAEVKGLVPTMVRLVALNLAFFHHQSVSVPPPNVVRYASLRATWDLREALTAKRSLFTVGIDAMAEYEVVRDDIQALPELTVALAGLGAAMDNADIAAARLAGIDPLGLIVLNDAPPIPHKDTGP